MYTSDNIADWFLASVDREAGDSITHLKLQKLVYYAQAWSLTLNSTALFEEDFEAWAHGPVVRSLYNRFSGNAWSELPTPSSNIDLDDEVTELLMDISESYGQLSAKRLEDLSHSETPWITARGNMPPEARSDAIISKDSISKYYTGQFDNIDG